MSLITTYYILCNGREHFVSTIADAYDRLIELKLKDPNAKLYERVDRIRADGMLEFVKHERVEIV